MALVRPDHLDRPHVSRLAPSDPRAEQIAAAHARAIAAGLDRYRDPASGFWVFTSAYLARRGSCCDTGCRHCPYVGA